MTFFLIVSNLFLYHFVVTFPISVFVQSTVLKNIWAYDCRGKHLIKILFVGMYHSFLAIQFNLWMVVPTYVTFYITQLLSSESKVNQFHIFTAAVGPSLNQSWSPLGRLDRLVKTRLPMQMFFNCKRFTSRSNSVLLYP